MRILIVCRLTLALWVEKLRRRIIGSNTVNAAKRSRDFYTRILHFHIGKNDEMTALSFKNYELQMLY